MRRTRVGSVYARHKHRRLALAVGIHISNRHAGVANTRRLPDGRLMSAGRLEHGLCLRRSAVDSEV